MQPSMYIRDIPAILTDQLASMSAQHVDLSTTYCVQWWELQNSRAFFDIVLPIHICQIHARSVSGLEMKRHAVWKRMSTCRAAK